MKKKVGKFSLLGLSVIYLNVCSGCATSKVMDKLSGGVVSRLFERKEETTEIMGGAIDQALFKSDERKYKIRDLPSLSRDADLCLMKGDYYLAAKAYAYAKNFFGMEAAAQVARDKNYFKDFIAISQGLIDNENFEYNPERGYNYAVNVGYNFKKPPDFFFSSEKKSIDTEVELGVEELE